MLDLAKASAIYETDFSYPFSTCDPKTGLGGIGFRRFGCVVAIVEGKEYYLDRSLEEVIKIADEEADEFDDIPF